MPTFTDVFERKEIKYRLSARQHRAMLAALAGIMVPDEFGRTDVVSLYFDTPERALIDRSLEKPLYKEKLRLRSYGMPSESDRVFVEIKKKYDGIVYKRRVGMSYAAARAYLGGMPYGMACAQHPLPDPVMVAESLAPRSLQIAREIDRFMLQHRPLRASMLVACKRTAYVSLDAPELGYEANGLRVTFDADIAYRDQFAPCPPAAPQPLLDEGEVIMEVKSSGPFPRWFAQALAACRAYPSSFSKYGEAYRACAAEGRKSVSAAAEARFDGERAVVGEASRVHTSASRHTTRPASAPAYAASSAHPVPRAAHSALEEAGECLSAGARDNRHRRFRAPNHAMKKGNRCA